jgi:hypothetical protein
MSKRKRGSHPPFVMLTKSTMATRAWRAMSCGARILYIELRSRLSNDYRNNGKVYLSDRDAAEVIGVTPGTIVKYYAENEHFGFLRKTSHGFLGLDGCGIADHYRVTEYPSFDNKGKHIAPTRDFDRWDGELFAYQRKRKKQNPVSKIHTPRVKNPHIKTGPDGSFLCVKNQHIEEPAPRVENPHVSRIATPSVKLRLVRGSLTAKAPAQAGEVGSSPAPVASLTDMVLSIVSAELDQLEAGRRCA